MPDAFTSMAVILGLAAAGGVLARAVRQPPLVGYILAGVLLTFFGGSMGQGQIKGLLETMSRLGVTLLLFLAGLELPLEELKRMGRVSLVTGLGQIAITSVLGFGLARLLGFGSVSAVYIGLAMTFGSTILVVKLLSEKGELQSLHGKIAVGYLLVQDFVAIGLLVILAGYNSGKLDLPGLVLVLTKGILMVTTALWVSEKFMGRIMNYLAKSTELLFISSIGWCLVVAAVVASPLLGFSVEIGGFLAGLALANAAEQSQIISRVRPLRDFFLTWFFVALGSNLGWTGWEKILFPGLVMTIYVFIGGPVIVMAILGLLGYKKRTYFMASLAVAQVSEFSLILVTNAVNNGQVGPEIQTLVTAVGVVTMTLSTYLIWHADSVYRKLSGVVGIFERKDAKEDAGFNQMKEHVVLFGHNRVGSRIRPVLEKTGWEVVVVDFNPEIVESLKNSGVRVIYGDMSDQELYEKLALNEASLIISTVPDITENLYLLKSLGKRKSQMLILSASDISEAHRLYKAGADYVLVPHSVGGEFLAQTFLHHSHGREASARLENLRDYLSKVTL